MLSVLRNIFSVLKGNRCHEAPMIGTSSFLVAGLPASHLFSRCLPRCGFAVAGACCRFFRGFSIAPRYLPVMLAGFWAMVSGVPSAMT